MGRAAEISKSVSLSEGLKGMTDSQALPRVEPASRIDFRSWRLRESSRVSLSFSSASWHRSRWDLTGNECSDPGLLEWADRAFSHVQLLGGLSGLEKGLDLLEGIRGAAEDVDIIQVGEDEVIWSQVGLQSSRSCRIPRENITGLRGSP